MFGQISFWIGLILGWVTAGLGILMIVVIAASIAFRAQRRTADVSAVQRLLERAGRKEGESNAGTGS